MMMMIIIIKIIKEEEEEEKIFIYFYPSRTFTSADYTQHRKLRVTDL